MKKRLFLSLASAALFATMISAISCKAGTSFKAGTYTGEGTGMGGKLAVSVTLSNKAIESVEITSQNETPGLSDKARATIPEAIVAEQRTNVDVVSGSSITSRAIMQATDAALKSAGVNVEKLNAATASSAETKAADVEKTADVIVVGAGGAGMAAGVQANQNGATVIIIEKTARVGGDTIMAGGALNAVDEGSETAKANKDSVALHYKQTYEGGDKQGDPDLIHTLTDNAWKGVEWLKSMGMEFKPGTFTVTGGLWPRAHKPVDPVGTGFFKTYNRYIDSHEGIEVMLNTKGESFIVENGKVVGVNAIGETGNKVTLRANKGVVLATGGFARNVEMREKYNKQWPTLGANIPSTNPPSSTGDAFAMLEPLHAQLVQMENIQLLPLGDPETGSLSGNIEMDVERRIFVNKNGDRFVDEGARRDTMTMALFHQPDNYMWIVLDSHCYPTGDEKNNFNESANELVAAGRAVKANSVEELAKAMNVPADHLKAALDDFNKHVADKSKDAFGRTLYSTPIDKPPFYAAPRVPTVHHTMGGVKIDTGCHVYNTDGKIIPGLYAAGEVTGGIHGANRLGGNALTDTVVFGRIAGTNAAAGK